MTKISAILILCHGINHSNFQKINRIIKLLTLKHIFFAVESGINKENKSRFY